MSKQPDLVDLIGIFFPTAADLGTFERVSPAEMPRVYRQLLAHTEHMTVKVEEFHQDRVDVEVLDRRRTGNEYARLILLRRQRDRRVVQFGIPRLKLELLEAEVRREIEAEKTPLGRVLIEHNVLREVELVELWRVQPGPALVRMFELPAAVETFGRTALIRCDGKPAIELLEIVAPEVLP